jgi:DNA-directed RNA polymerase III subunit RPC1
LGSDLKKGLNIAIEDLNPSVALRLFSEIEALDAILFNMDPYVSKVSDLLITNLLIPPICIRTSVETLGGVKNEYDLTHKLS